MKELPCRINIINKTVYITDILQQILSDTLDVFLEDNSSYNLFHDITVKVGYASNNSTTKGKARIYGYISGFPIRIYESKNTINPRKLSYVFYHELFHHFGLTHNDKKMIDLLQTDKKFDFADKFNYKNNE